MLKNLVIILLTVILIFVGGTLYVLQTDMFGEPDYNDLGLKTVWVNGGLELFNQPIVSNSNTSYMDIESAKKILGLDLVWDLKNAWIIMNNDKNIYRIKCLNHSIQKNREKDIPFSGFAIIGGIPYLEIGFLEQYSNYNIEFNELSKQWKIDEEKMYESMWEAKKPIRIREKKDEWSKVLDKIDVGSQIIRYRNDEIESDWIYIMSEHNIRGYVKKEDVQKKKVFKVVETKPVEESIDKKPLNITWEAVYNVPIDYNKTEKMSGLDIIIPTWFEMTNEFGSYRDKSDKGYVAWANSNGYEIWGLFNNGMNPDFTHNVVSDAKVRMDTINRIVDLAIKNKLKGINIDFENVYETDKDMLVQFVKELYPIALENNLILSMDVTRKGGSANWSRCYDRKELAKYVDYLMLMAYDEHWASSPVAGSVASIPWVEESIKGLLEEVPEDKLILGIPFYTRRWETYVRGNSSKVKSATFSPLKTKELIKNKDLEIIYDDASKQNYVTYKVGNSKFEIWIEDKESLEKRIELVNKYNLAGVASWARVFADSEFWNIIESKMH